ncbi:MAG: hypothetical protein CMP23_09245 [Rickettsiales bacterium]|nr:hypothetical protein [Rickettsiales bacterium]|tara:strand:+ start:2555 stop:3292 length:738 start_codon:yes stop_codon:yes gene_type:complete
MTSPGLRIAVAILRTLLLHMMVLIPLITLIGSMDRGLSLVGALPNLIQLFLPLALATASAAVLASARCSGEWDLSSMLGYTAGLRLAPALTGALLLGICGLLWSGTNGPLNGTNSAAILNPLPAPIESGVSIIRIDGRWKTADLSLWSSRPAELSLPELMERLAAARPEGLRRGPDRAELCRRLGWSLALPLAIACGAACALRGRRPSPSGRERYRLTAPLHAGLLIGLWLLTVLLGSSWLSAQL